MHADRWAPWSLMFLAVCLTGTEPVAGLVSALGLTALLEPTVLLPLLALLMGVTFWSLGTDRRYHRNPNPSRAAWAGGALIFAGHWTVAGLTWAGVALVAAATAWNRREVRDLSPERARARAADRRLG